MSSQPQATINPEAAAKITNILNQVAGHPGGENFLRKAMAELGYSLFYKVETRQLPVLDKEERLAGAQAGVILDCETTGLVPGQDKITQLAMIKVLFDQKGIISFGERFDRLRDPGKPIPAEVTELTGITDEMVRGKAITDQEVADFIGDARTCIAHKADFDRVMLEADFASAGFDKLRWDCSLAQIDWKARGIKGASLEMITKHFGFDYDAHNALSDILALGHVLSEPGRNGKPSLFEEMWTRGCDQTVQIVAVNSSFHVKDQLKDRGYKFSMDGSESNGFPKTWHITIPGTEEKILEEAAFLASQIYSKDMALPLFRFGPENRYSARRPAQETLNTTEPSNLLEAICLRTTTDGEYVSQMQLV